MGLRKSGWYESHASKHHFAINVWARNIGDFLLGLNLLSPRLDGQKYYLILKTLLPTFLGTIFAHIFQDMWFHFMLKLRDSCDYDWLLSTAQLLYVINLKRTFGAWWISKGGVITWPTRFPDLSPINFFLWGAMINHVYCLQNPCL